MSAIYSLSIGWCFGCTSLQKTKEQDASTDSAQTEEPAFEPLDQDGDGWPHWTEAEDPTQADCDDLDPLVTPLTERWIPAGEFILGNDLEPGATPSRAIWLGDYCLDRYEVTNADFLSLLEAQLIYLHSIL